MARMTRRAYADMFGPTVGDRVRLADTELVCRSGEEISASTGKR